MFNYILYCIRKLERSTTESKDFEITEKEIRWECKAIFDKVATNLLICEFENEIIINGLLKLTKMERIVVVLHIVNDMTLLEVAYLLDVDISTLYVHKKNAIKKLRTDYEKYYVNNRFTGFKEVQNINDAKNHPGH